MRFRFTVALSAKIGERKETISVPMFEMSAEVRLQRGVRGAYANAQRIASFHVSIPLVIHLEDLFNQFPVNIIDIDVHTAERHTAKR